MVFKVKVSHIICVFAMLLAVPDSTVANTAEVQQLLTGGEVFGNNLFSILARDKNYLEDNIIISPFCIQTNLIMVRLGADGETAHQIDHALGLPNQERVSLAANYNKILAEYENSDSVKTATKIYAMAGYTVQEEFEQLLTKQLYSSVDFLDFYFNNDAANSINSWVKERTNNLITDLVDPDTLDSMTRLVLVNAIYFKGTWKYQFSDVYNSYFYLDQTRKIKTEMMYIQEDFNYAVLPELNATVLELRYQDSDLQMLIIVPNKRTGLAQLEYSLGYTSLAHITQQLKLTKVDVNIPKFKALFSAKLEEPLSKLDIERMFSENAEFGKMLTPSEGLKVSSVVHKAFIEVNEKGTEAAAASSSGLDNRFGSAAQYFTADRPFHYVIKNTANLVLFKGHVKNPSLLN